jgi:hypothetical protein
MDNKELSRRSFLSLTVMGCLSLSAISLLASCKKKPEMEKEKGVTMEEGKSTSKEPCTDISGLTDQEKQTRIVNHYVGDSTIEGKECDGCSFFIKPAFEDPCGTCQIVKGPIDPDGYCTAWVAKGA